MMVSNCSMRGLSIERQVLGRRSSMTWSMVISNLKLNCHKRDQKYTEYCMLRRTLLPVFFLCGGEIILLGGQCGWHHGSWFDWFCGVDLGGTLVPYLVYLIQNVLASPGSPGTKCTTVCTTMPACTPLELPHGSPEQLIHLGYRYTRTLVPPGQQNCSGLHGWWNLCWHIVARGTSFLVYWLFMLQLHLW